jgi:ribosome biogenesis protein Nip4
MGLKVKVPMILKVDNKGVVDLVNNWSIGGRTRHVTTKVNFLRELKEEGVLKVIWISTNDNSSYMFTKNLLGSMFNKHSKVKVSDGITSTDSQEEGVGGTVSTVSPGSLVIENHRGQSVSHPQERENYWVLEEP